jgi:hypothetical protein
MIRAGGSMNKIHEHLDSWHVRVGRSLWRHHPGVRSEDELSRGERAADRLRNGMGDAPS